MNSKRYLRIVAIVALAVAGVVAGSIVRRTRATSGSGPVSDEPALSVDRPGDLPALLHNAPMPPLPQDDSTAGSAIRELAGRGKARLLSGDGAGARAAWDGLRNVPAAGDRGALAWARIMDAHGARDEVRRFFATDAPPEATPEYYRFAAGFYLRDLRYREGYHCFNRIAETTADAVAATARGLCYRLATEGESAAPLRELAEACASAGAEAATEALRRRAADLDQVGALPAAGTR